MTIADDFLNNIKVGDKVSVLIRNDELDLKSFTGKVVANKATIEDVRIDWGDVAIVTPRRNIIEYRLWNQGD